MSDTLDPSLHTDDIAKRIETELMARLGDTLIQRLTRLDLDTIRACCQDAAEIQVRALVASTPDERQRLLRERAWIHAQLCNLVAAGGTQAANAFWDVVHVIVNGAVAIAFAAV
jgi:hypothetical protein